MSGDRYDVDSEVILPAGMEIVVPPAATDASDEAEDTRRGVAGRSASGAKQVSFPPVHRGALRRAPAL